MGCEKGRRALVWKKNPVCVCLCVCLSLSLCVCVCVYEREREREKKHSVQKNKTRWRDFSVLPVPLTHGSSLGPCAWLGRDAYRGIRCIMHHVSVCGIKGQEGYTALEITVQLFRLEVLHIIPSLHRPHVESLRRRCAVNTAAPASPRRLRGNLTPRRA